MILTINNTRANPASLPAGSAASLNTSVYQSQQADIPWLLTLTVAGAVATTSTGITPGGSGSPGSTVVAEAGVLRGNGAGDYLHLAGRGTIGYTLSSSDGWSGSIQWQASIDGVTWVNVGSPVTAVTTALGVLTGWYAPYLDMVVSTTSGTAQLAIWARRS